MYNQKGSVKYFVIQIAVMKPSSLVVNHLVYIKWDTESSQHKLALPGFPFKLLHLFLSVAVYVASHMSFILSITALNHVFLGIHPFFFPASTIVSGAGSFMHCATVV